MKRLLGFIKDYKWLMILGPCCKAIEAFFELFNPLLVSKIINVGVINGDKPYIVRMGIIIFVLNIVSFGFSLLGQKCASLSSAGTATKIRNSLFSKISTFSHPDLDKFGTASLVNRMTNDVNQVENAISTFARTLIRIPLLLIGAFILSLIINIKMSIVFLVLIPIICLVLYAYMRMTSPYFKKVRIKLDAISRVTKENLSGTRVIRAFNKQADEQKRFEAVSEDYTKISIRVGKLTVMLEPVVYLILDAATATLLLLGGNLINIGELTQGDMIALLDYVAIITISLLLFSQIIAIFVRTIASIHRIDEVLATEPTIQDLPNAKEYRKLKYDALLEFDDVSFNYSLDKNEPSFIKDLSFKVYPHQTIGIIGGTGSGKSTIANLMTRFYDPVVGTVKYKGKDIREFKLKQIRKEISIVQQRSTLFSGSLRKNMQIRDKNATDEEIINALKISQAWPFVSEWKNGLDYQIMAGGKNVSGGQMQRLTIARAIIGGSELMILDDSSSALDFLTESNLRKELNKLDTTFVIISQRATTIKSADLIIVLDNGDVVGMGKHEDLIQNCDIYKEIYESQTK